MESGLDSLRRGLEKTRKRVGAAPTSHHPGKRARPPDYLDLPYRSPSTETACPDCAGIKSSRAPGRYTSGREHVQEATSTHWPVERGSEVGTAGSVSAAGRTFSRRGSSSKSSAS